MFYRTDLLAAVALTLGALATTLPVGSARAADADAPTAKAVKVKPVPGIPFFLVVDDRLSFSYIPKGTDPGVFSVQPNGTINGTTAKQVYNFTHFDVWAYGTNFFTISMFKSDHNDPAAPCTNSGTLAPFGGTADCAGATEFFGIARSTFGWNEIFDTKAFSQGPLHNVSFEVGGNVEAENSYFAPSERSVVAGLQFAFDLPYKGYLNVAPLFYDELNRNAFIQCGLFGTTATVNCNLDGNVNYHPTWALELNYYMNLNFLPESMQYFALSGRATFIGPKGNENAPLGVAGGGVETKTEINSEPIRLTFDASKFIWGKKYSQFLTTWVAYRYWQNKFGLDHANSPTCNVSPGLSNNSCTEESVYAGVTVKF